MSRSLPGGSVLTRLTPLAYALSLTITAGVLSPSHAQPSYLALAVPGLHAQSLTANQGEASQYLLIRTGSQRANEAGMELVHHYGAVQLWKARGSAIARMATLPNALVQKTTLDVPSGEFDPLASGAAVNANSGGDIGPQVHLVQFVGPAADEWLDQVRATGAVPIQYVNNNAWQVLVRNETGRASLASLNQPWLRYSGRMTASQKIATSLDSALAEGRSEIRATVVLAEHDTSSVSKRAIEARIAQRGDWHELGDGQIALEFEGSAQAITEIAQLGDVLVVELRGERTRMDEVQAQIMAGHLTADGTVPSGPGYLEWLTGLGFSTTPTDYPIISIVDDGLGDGNTANGAGDFRLQELGVSGTRVTYGVSCNASNTVNNRRGSDGHGHINATIAVGYDQNVGWPFRDVNGYLRGQGMNPFGRVANFEIFRGSTSGNCGSGDAGLIAAQAAQGIKISNNSWGYCLDSQCTAPLVTYNAAARAYDLGVRDANGAADGSPSMIVVFAAGNDGSGPNTVATPALGKNVIAVGASENARPTSDDSAGNIVAWNDGCGVPGSGANSAMDVIGFSSRGPSVGGRIKPELIGPGTHVQGSASTANNYATNGNGVCDQYLPAGQTSLAASSGTSHSAPAVAGAASLVYRYLQTDYGLADPSPALIKSYFIAHPTYLTGTGANDTLPSNTQGYGMPNLEAAFDPSTARIMVDQHIVFGSTGDGFADFVGVANPAKPVRIALSWTDAAGAAGSSSPQVNNLDLEVTVDGQTYKGNHFAGQWSTTGGTADTANNYEAVFLPPGTSGAIAITVTATAINGDGVPGNADLTDQDFALVCSNCTTDVTFNVNAAPSQADVCAGAMPQFAVDVYSINGYNSSVDLSITSPPAGAGMSFSANPVTAPGNSTLTVDTSGVATGNYTFGVVGSDGSDVRTSNVLLNVSAAAPAAFALTSPANYATGVSTSPVLAWAASSEAVSYTVEVATDAAFGNVIWSQTVTGTTTNVPGLAFGTQYHWRVAAQNPCGTLAASQGHTFVTKSQASVLLVDDSWGVSDLSRWTSSLDTVLGAGNYDIRDTSVDGEPASAAELDPYNRVIWFSGGVYGNPGTYVAGPNPTSEALLGNWLDNGACLLISSQDYRYDRGENSAFMANYLGATVQTQDVTANTQTGQNVYAGITANLTHTGLFAGYPDRLNTVGSGQYSFRYNASGAGSFAGTSMSVESPNPYFTTFLAFGLEAATVPQRQAVLEKFFDTCTHVGNEAPVAVDDSITVEAGATADTLDGGASSVRDNDTDAEDGTPAGDVLLFAPPAHGSLVLNLDGTFSYTHDGGASTSDSFKYRVLDSEGASSGAGTVSITITAVNHVPVADSQSVTTSQDVAVSITLTGSDEDDDTLSFTVVTQPSHGVLSGTAPNLTYTPNAGYNGPDSFTFTVSDGVNTSAEATVSITVEAVNEAPTFIDDPYAFGIVEGSPAASHVGTVLATDADDDSVSYAIVSGNTGDAFQLDASSGQITVLTASALGTAGTIFTLTVSASDGVASDTATVTIEVLPASIFSDGFEEAP